MMQLPQKLEQLLQQPLAFAQNIESLTTNQAPIDMVDLTNLWQVLGMIYGRRFWSCFGQHPNKVWFKVLEGLTLRELHYGILKLFKYRGDSHDDKQAWPPNAKEFLMLCRYKAVDFGLPGVDEAYRAAKDSVNRPLFIWPHVCVYLAASDVDVAVLKQETPQHYYRFKQSYERFCQQAMRGVDLGDSPNRGVIDDVAAHASHPDVAMKYLENCFNALQGSKAQ